MLVGLLAAELTHNNGWAHYSTSMIDALHRAGIETRIISAQNSPAGTAGSHILPPVTPAPRFSLLRGLLRVTKIQQHLKDCDIIHSLIEPYALYAAAVANERPLFITVHGSYARLPEVRRFPIGALYRSVYGAAHLIAVSEHTATVARQVTSPRSVTVIPNGVDAGRFAHLQRNPSPRPIIMTSGGVKHRKGVLELVRAMAQVKETLPDAKLIVAGTTDAEPAYVAAVRAEITALSLENNVELAGFLPEDELMALYESANVYVLPSVEDGWKFEGFGLTLLEASAAGIPVISVTGSGTAEAVIDGVTGLLVDRAKIDTALANAITRLLTDNALAQQFGDAGRDHARRMSWDAAAAHVIELYASVYARK